MTAAQSLFDADRYKTSTREQWESAAAAWHRWAPLLHQWLGPATERMLDMAGIDAGHHVLDVAAGAGEQTLAVARRIGPTGAVLATDISPAILAFAQSAARAAGLNNVQTRELDGERLDQLAAASFDAVISRVGLIYFPDQQRALAGMRHALKPGGKVAAIVYSTAERNRFFSIPVSIIRKRAQLPPPLPGQPGPFSLGAPGVLEKAFVDAGFREVRVEAMAAPVRLPSAAECVRFEQESFGALHQMLSSLSPQERSETWREIETALTEFEQQGAFVGPCEMLIGVGTK